MEVQSIAGATRRACSTRAGKIPEMRIDTPTGKSPSPRSPSLKCRATRCELLPVSLNFSDVLVVRLRAALRLDQFAGDGAELPYAGLACDPFRCANRTLG